MKLPAQRLGSGSGRVGRAPVPSSEPLELQGSASLPLSLRVRRTSRLLRAFLTLAPAPALGLLSGLLHTFWRGQHSPQVGTREHFEARACLLLGQPALAKVPLELAIGGGPE